ncbi:UNVERIFIED_CONTAM: hypothetical protein Sindi_0664500 [Sesamum indicum]
MADSKKSMEFQRLLSNSDLKYYYHGYRHVFPNPQMQIFHAGLANAPEPDKEVPCELLETLLHTSREGETLIDLGDQMVEVPLKVIPPTGSDETFPPPADK